VPDAKGVPPVNPPSAFDPATNTITVDAPAPTTNGKETAKKADAKAVAKQTKPAWGIFDKKGGLALAADSVREVEDDKEYNVPRYPLEGGGFQSYNKVEMPKQVHVIVTKGGTASDKSSFIAKVDKLTASLDLFTIVTPEQTHRNMNLTKNGKSRTAESGAGLISVHLTFDEARISVTTAFTDVKEPSGADNQNGGAVQTQTPKANQAPGAKPQ
jgi:hypothetical protein